MPLLVKICGLKTPEALDAALDAGADMVGFVFFAPSPRNLGYEAARALGRQVAGRARKVALSVDATDAALAAAIDALKPDMLQLHGKEAPERVASVRSRFRLPVMKALPIEQKSDLAPVREYEKVADWLLFDARAPREATRPGGLGKTFDWHLLENLRLAIPFMLSGGLDAGNVGEAIAITRARRGRRVVRRRTRAGREGPGQDSRLHPRRAHRRQLASSSAARWRRVDDAPA